MTLADVHKEADALQKRFGAPELSAIYGAGRTQEPDAAFVFMNPTGKNPSADPSWPALRAPWIGSKDIWVLLHDAGLLGDDAFALTQGAWTPESAAAVYEDIARHNIYITNLAKCTQLNARALPDSVFREYLPSTLAELALIKPKKIVTFGNQVSSILLNKKVSVNDYEKDASECIEIGGTSTPLYPVHYPVGQGRRNQPLTLARLRAILK